MFACKSPEPMIGDYYVSPPSYKWIDTARLFYPRHWDSTAVFGGKLDLDTSWHTNDSWMIRFYDTLPAIILYADTSSDEIGLVLWTKGYVILSYPYSAEGNGYLRGNRFPFSSGVAVFSYIQTNDQSWKRNLRYNTVLFPEPSWIDVDTTKGPQFW